MAFGLPNTASSTGPFLGRLQYDSSQGNWTIVHRVQQPDGRFGDQKQRPFYEPLPTFLIDFGSIEVGFLKFYPSPEFRVVPYGQELPPAPDEIGADQNGRQTKLFRPGFRAKIYAPKLFGTKKDGKLIPDHDAFWFSNVAKGVLDAVDAMYKQFLASPEAARGQVPVLTCTEVTESKINRNTIYTPTFAITHWADRPEAFGERTVPPPGRRSMGVTMAPTPAKPVTKQPMQNLAPAHLTQTPMNTEPPPNDDEWGDAPTQERTKVPMPAGDIDDDIPF